MNKAFFVSLYDYNFWAHRRVWECVMQLDEPLFHQELEYSVGSIFIQVVHTMGVEYWWSHFLCEGVYDFLNPDDYPTRDFIRATWDKSEMYIRAYLDSLTDEALQRLVKPKFWDENEVAIPVWQALLQVANHSTDHRAQTLAGLHRLGAPTVGQDYLDYLHRESGSA
ncbi:MAG: hypothetical protein K8I82_28010 [Anaerolineae bacterium]|nr:hypothetical protein [Anaerolineae bacterium]